MAKNDFISIVNKHKVEAKEALPSFPKAFYMSHSFLYVAIYDDGSFKTSCDNSILAEAEECFMLVSGITIYDECWHIL